MPATKKARRARRAVSRQEAAGAANAPDASSPYLLLSGYEGANPSPMRGYLYWPQGADTRRELPAYSDQEIRRRSHWMYANTGIGRRIIDGLAMFKGVDTPIPTTPDADWNKETFQHFKSRAGQPELFDRRGRDSWDTYQLEMEKRALLDGRLLSVLTENLMGGAQLMAYEAHQIRNGGDNITGYEEGVRLDAMDKHTGYLIQDGQNPRQFTPVDARDAVYYANWDGFGRIHGTPILAHALADLQDVVELRGLRKHAAKAAAGFGVAIEQDNQVAITLPGGQAVAPMLGALIQEQMGTGEIDEDTGKEKTTPVTLEKVLQGGAMATLKPGQRVKIVSDDRPTQNNMDFERLLVESVIMGCRGIPPAVLYYVAGKTGPNVRADMEQVRRWISIEMMRRAIWARRIWGYWVAKEIKMGRLSQPKNGRYWDQVIFIGSPDMTIDEGRHGQLAVSRLRAGLTTWMEEWAVWAEYAPWKLEERIEEFAAAKAKCAEMGAKYNVPLTISEIFPEFVSPNLQAAA